MGMFGIQLKIGTVLFEACLKDFLEIFLEILQIQVFLKKLLQLLIFKAFCFELYKIKFSIKFLG